MPVPPFQDPRVAAVFDGYAAPVRARLLELRALVFDTADGLDGVGPVEESLRWGEPAYLTAVSGTGTTIRLHSKDPTGARCAMYVHCQTDLVARWRDRWGDALVFEGTRAIVLDVDRPLPVEPLRDCIAMALTYKVRKRRG